MTSPVVGQVSVEIVGDVKRFAQSLKAQMQSAIRDAASDVKVSVSANTTRLRAEILAATRGLKAKVDVDVDRSSLGGLKSLLDGASSSLSGVASSASGLGSLSGPVGALGAALVGLAAAAAGLVVGIPAISAFAGAVAALPALLAGVGAGIGTLALGFKGIGDAFKPKTGGGGGGRAKADPAARARQIAAAERGVEAARRGIAAATRGVAAAERSYADAQQRVVEAQQRVADAQKRVTQVQEALNRARREATEDIDDLGRALRGAVLDEESAALGVSEALRELNKVKETEVLPDIERADLAYRQAQLTLENATDTVGDLGEESDDAAKKGVEGSDKVQSALADQADAYRAVQDAQLGVRDAENGVISAHDGLLSAQDSLKSSTDGLLAAQEALAAAQAKVAAGGGGGGLAKEVVKLAPAAQAFVDAIKALKPAFESLRLDVQQRLFEGLDKTVTNLGNAWIPALKVTLGSYADTFNSFFKNLGKSLVQPKFISDIQAGAEGARQGLEKVGTSITTSLVPAFGALSKAAGPFLSQLGTEIAGIVTDFSNWVLEGEKTGGLKSFFDKATEALHDIFTTGKLVGAIIGKIVGAIIGSGSDTKKTPIDSFNEALAKVSKWLDDPKNQQKIRDFVTELGNLIVDVGRFVKDASDFATQVDGIATKIGNVLGGYTTDGTKPLGKALWDGIKQGFTDAINATGNFIAGLLWDGPDSLVGKIKSGLGIASPSTVMAEVGKDVIRGLFKGIGDMFPSLGQVAGRAKTWVVNAVSSAGTWLSTTGRNVIIGLGNGITSMFRSLGTWAGQARAWVSNALSNSASWLTTHGGNAVIGLWNGIASWGGWLWNKVVSFVQSYVVNPVKDFLHISSPSKLMAEMGGYVTQGLAIGMESEAGRVQDAADMIAAAAVPTLADVSLGSLGSAADMALSSSLSAASQQQVLLTVDGSRTGDWLIDGLRGAIKLKYNGDPVRAFATS